MSATATVGRQAAEIVVRRDTGLLAGDGTRAISDGVRATVALYCVRPDLINEATLEEIGHVAGRSKQAVHQLADSFRETSAASESVKDRDIPKTIVATPNTAMHTNMVRPTRRVSGAHTSISDTMIAPTAGAALSNPRPEGPAWSMSRA